MRNSHALWICLGSTLIATAGCAADNPVANEELAVLADHAEIDFSTRPSYLPENVVVLTFDDGPDWNNTARTLDVLRDKNVKSTFFINTENWSNVNTDAPMQELVRRMVREGHELASHSVHHLSLPTLSASRIEEELVGVEQTVNRVVGPGAPRMTLFRAPFGEPYQGNDPNFPSPGYQLVAPIVARHAVHIGWAIDSFDYRCTMGDGACVFENVRSAIQTPGIGAHGVILFHSVHSQTVAALPDIIDYLRANRFEIWSTEDVVRARFGRSSAEIVDGGGGGDDGGGDDGGDDGGGDDGGDDGGGDDGGGDDGGGDDGGGGDCEPFRAGTAYQGGDRVSNVGNIYTCKPWPYSGWCGIGGPYEPGVGWAWGDAWTLGGTCD
jgi:peptidoglycan/xylan/chitin deacetylase (PgdA/CDA1 family)